MNRTNRKVKTNERGMVAIVVTIFFMLILSLIVLAFSQAARRGQRQTLDDQLARQAFYAAESGINETKKKIDAGAAPYNQPRVDNCNTIGVKQLSSDNVISYSCVLYEKQLEVIKFDEVSNTEGETINLSTSNGVNLPDITISWSSADRSTAVTSCPTTGDPITAYTKTQADCNPGMIKAIIMSAGTSNQSRQDLIGSMFTTFFRPAQNGGGGSVAYSAYSGAPYGNQGNVVWANCANARCSATITGPLPANAYLHLRAIGKKIGNVDISTSSGQTFNKAQIQIDVTGRANDVLRRLQVRKASEPVFDHSSFALDVMDGICKRLDVYPGSADYTDCFPDLVGQRGTD